MKNKVVKILFFSAIIMLFTGCGKEETVFDTMSFSQNPINVSNPITDPEVTNETIRLDDDNRNLYYDRYEPEDDYIPSQIANTSYSKDELGNEIPNGLLNFDFDRQKLRAVDELVNDYNIAEEGEYKWIYKYQSEDKTTIPRDYFTLIRTVSLVGKPKDEESLDFDDFKLSAYYDYANANTIEDLSVEVNNKGTTKDVSDFSKHLFSSVMSEDFKSILMNTPNTSDSDTTQIYSGSVLTEDKNSSYAFYREFKTPLKEGEESVSANYDIKFLDSYTQRQLAKKNIVNNQSMKVSNYLDKIDFGFMKENDVLTNIKSAKNSMDKYVKTLPKTSYSYTLNKKDYDIYKYFKYTTNTNLNPADKFTPIEKHSYSTKFNYFGNYNDIDGETKSIQLGTITVDYQYTKTDDKFSSLMYHFTDSLDLPKEGIRKFEENGQFDIEKIVDKKVKMLLSTVDIKDETFYTNYNKSLFTELNDLYCKVTVKITTRTSGNIYGLDIDLLIESDDIYGVNETDIVSENSEIEYDLEGNIINKQKDDSLSKSEIADVLEDLDIEEETSNEEVIVEVEETTPTKENIEESQKTSTSNGGDISDFF